jgi:type II secretory pathway predicted ATPase ExeA
MTTVIASNRRKIMFRHFGMVQEPFTREFKPGVRIPFDFLNAEIAQLKTTIASRQSAVLVGPAGTGKSVILRALSDELPAAKYQISYIKLSSLGVRDMCRQVTSALYIPSRGSTASLVQSMSTHCLELITEARLNPVIVFDDAHEMRPETLRILKALTNFVMDSKLVVSVVLCGQLPLKDLILSAALEDIRQRLTYCGTLRPLTQEETSVYIGKRCAIAGATNNPFTEEARTAVFEISRGTMRAIDKMCAASLRVAAESNATQVSAADVAVARASQWI